MFKRALLATAVAVALLIPSLAYAQVKIEDRLAPDQPLVVIAHRAAGGGAPENSLAGIQFAIERGIDMVEVDVQKTHGGGYILMHDPNLLRTTNVAEVFPEGSPQRDPEDAMARRFFVSDHTLEDTARLRLRDPQGGDHPVPTLDEALELAEGRLLMLLELKKWDIESLTALLERHDTRNVLLFSQVARRKLRDTALAAEVGVYASIQWANVSAGFDEAIEFYGPSLKMVGVSSDVVSPEFVAKAEAHGVRVNNNSRFGVVLQADGTMAPWLETTFQSGAAAVTTGQPVELLQLLGR